MIRAVAAKVVATTIATVLTEKFVMNVLVILAEWAVKRWGNDLAADLFRQFRDALDRDHGQPMNLYNEIRDRDPDR